MQDLIALTQLILNLSVAASALYLALTVPSLFTGDRRLREELETYKKLLESKDMQLESLKKDYEARLRELHERITILEGLDKALRSGKIRIVEAGSNKECRVLVDGTIICGDHALKV